MAGQLHNALQTKTRVVRLAAKVDALDRRVPTNARKGINCLARLPTVRTQSFRHLDDTALPSNHGDRASGGTSARLGVAETRSMSGYSERRNAATMSETVCRPSDDARQAASPTWSQMNASALERAATKVKKATLLVVDEQSCGRRAVRGNALGCGVQVAPRAQRMAGVSRAREQRRGSWRRL